MSIWKVLLMWLTSLAAMGCIGFLMAGILALNRGADELAVKMRPPAPPSKTPPRIKWWFWPLQVVIFTFAISADHLSPRAQQIFMIVNCVLLGSLAAVIVIRGFIFGWRAQRDGRFCITAAAACALFAASSGYALWRFN